MRGYFPVLLDACVLIPMPLADTLLRLASSKLYHAKWTDHIMAEVSRNLQDKFGLSQERARYRESEIRRHFPEAWVEGYQELIPVMTNQEKDRHVLAAAVRARAEVIVTYDTKDFQLASLAPYSVIVQKPSTFLKNLYQLAPAAVVGALTRQASAIGQTLPQLLTRLRLNVPGFVSMLEEALILSSEPESTE